MIKNTYFGFTNNLKPMHKAKAENVLDGLIRAEEGVMTEKEWAYNKLVKGYKPAKEENYQEWSRRTGELTKPKTLYKLESSEGYYNEINKTVYDYAVHIVSNGYTDKEKAEAYITAEAQRIEEENRIKAEQAAKERAEREAEKQAEEAERKERKEAREQAIQDAANAITAVEWQTIESIDKYVKTEYSDMLNDVLVDKKVIAKIVVYDRLWPEAAIANIKYYKELTEEGSKNPNASNEMLKRREKIGQDIRRLFFGITLEMSPQTVRALLKGDMTAEEAYNRIDAKEQRKTAQEAKQETFYRLINGEGFVEAKGEKIVVNGITAYGMDNQGSYWLIEERTGCLIAKGKNKTEAKNNLTESIDKNGIDKIQALIIGMIQKNGLSPMLKDAM